MTIVRLIRVNYIINVPDGFENEMHMLSKNSLVLKTSILKLFKIWRLFLKGVSSLNENSIIIGSRDGSATVALILGSRLLYAW